MASQLKPFTSRIARYFKSYGGWRSVFTSPLFLFSVLVSAVSYGHWIDDKWSIVAQSVLPNLLGFSLGTYAILFSLMTGRLKRALKTVKNDAGISFLEEINATFFHFILVQVGTILWSFIYQGTLLHDLTQLLAPGSEGLRTALAAGHYLGGAVGFAFLIYSIALVVASALAVYRLALIVDPQAE